MDTGEVETGLVWTGKHVVLELKLDTGEVERVELDIVQDNAADFDCGFLGESTPLAKAIIGKPAGAMIPYHVGDIVQVCILSIKSKLNSAPVDLTERREKVIQKAVQDSDRISTIIYASTMSNKWGDMDPNILIDQDHEQDEQKNSNR